MLSLEEILLVDELSTLSVYLDVMNQSLKQRKQEIETSIKPLLERIPYIDNGDDIISVYAKLGMKDTDDMNSDELKVQNCIDIMMSLNESISLFYSSYIVLWFSFMERKLKKVCKSLDLKIEVSIDNCENIGRGIIDRAKKLLQIAKGYQIDSDSWKELTKIREIRNLLVHNGQLLPLKEQRQLDDNVILDINNDLIEYLQNHELLNDSRIEPGMEYCKYLIKFSDSFLRKLYFDVEKQ